MKIGEAILINQCRHFEEKCTLITHFSKDHISLCFFFIYLHHLPLNPRCIWWSMVQTPPSQNYKDKRRKKIKVNNFISFSNKRIYVKKKKTLFSLNFFFLSLSLIINLTAKDSCCLKNGYYIACNIT